MYPTCLEADECRPGLLECHGIPLLVPILFLLVGFSMQLLDRGHHPYISTGFDGHHFTPLVQIRSALPQDEGTLI